MRLVLKYLNHVSDIACLSKSYISKECILYTQKRYIKKDVFFSRYVIFGGKIIIDTKTHTILTIIKKTLNISNSIKSQTFS